MNEPVVGTAGHVDHGKTALIRALTGIDCDAVPEERRRSMTIEVGFASWRLPSGRTVSVVDVPGHERFIRTMAVGARSIDLALLCVAADDGVMPQTREHAAVLRVLGVRQVVPVVTKVDLAPERAAGCAEEVGHLLDDTGLPHRPWVGCSSITGVGLEELAAAVDHELGRIPAPLDRGIPRLLVDRSFTMVGTGTVVTGLLDGGAFRQGQQIEVFPSGARGRVQAMQRRGQLVDTAEPGGRLAVALHGVELAEAPRGSVVGLPHQVVATHTLDCSVFVPRAGAFGVRQGMHLEVLAGAAAAPARIWLAGETELGPGASAFAQIHLESPLCSLPGDLLVLRAPSPRAILGGALVIDSQPQRHRRWVEAPLETWGLRERHLVQASLDGLRALAILEVVGSPLGKTPKEVAARVGLAHPSVLETLEQACAEGVLVRLGSRYLSAESWRELFRQAQAALREHELVHPLAPGMVRGELLRGLGLKADGDGEAALRQLHAEGAVELRGPLATLPGRPPIGVGTAATARVMATISRAGRTPPGVAELRDVGLTKEVQGHLVRAGEVVALTPDTLISRLVLDEMEADLEELLAVAPAGLTVAEIRDHLHSTRRIVVPLLERWERDRRSERRGDRHRLLRSAS